MNRNSGTCKLSTKIFTGNIYSEHKSCENNLHIERSYSPDITRLRSECISLTDNQLSFKSAKDDESEISRGFITRKSSTQNHFLIESYCNYIKASENIQNKNFCNEYFSSVEEKSDQTSLKNSSNLIQLRFDLDTKPVEELIQHNQITFMSNITNSRMPSNSKKCFMFRSTLLYKKCLVKYYKCIKYRKNPVKLKNCREAFKNLLI